MRKVAVAEFLTELAPHLRNAFLRLSQAAISDPFIEGKLEAYEEVLTILAKAEEHPDA